MKQNFTKFTSVLIVISCLCIYPLKGQKMEMGLVESFTSCRSEPTVQLRATTLVRDSSVTYTASGERIKKSIFYENGDGTATGYCYKMENNKWVDDNCTLRGMYLQQKVEYAVVGEQLRLIFPTSIYTTGYWYFTGERKFNPTFDTKGNLTSLEVSEGIVFLIKYDANNDPLSIDLYENNKHIWKATYNFSFASPIDGVFIGSISLFESYIFNETTSAWEPDPNIRKTVSTFLRWATPLYVETYRGVQGSWIGDQKFSTEYDSNGRRAIEHEYVWYANRWSEVQYTVYFYPNSTPPISKVVDNKGVGSNNNGLIGYGPRPPFYTDQLDKDREGAYVKNAVLNADEQEGRLSFAVKFPSGFTLDKNNTFIENAFGIFDIVASEQEGNTWSFEIKAASTRSAELRSDGEQNLLVNIAYNVDEKLVRGIYDVIIHSIELQKSDGENIQDPAITVPVEVNRWGVDNEPISILSPVVFAGNQTIHIQAEKTEMITVYSVMGQKLHETAIQLGLHTINASQFPQGILIIKGSSGWIKKLIVK